MTDRVFLPGSLGEFEVLNHHAPIISTLTAGYVKWGDAGSDVLETMAVKGGVARVQDNIIQLCVEV